jgi:hypothetical protein
MEDIWLFIGLLPALAAHTLAVSDCVSKRFLPTHTHIRNKKQRRRNNFFH